MNRMAMLWEEFEQERRELDDAWWDIIIPGTTLQEWDAAARFIADGKNPITFSGDWGGARFPDDMARLFKNPGGTSAAFGIDISGAVLNCDFYSADEISFALDPHKVTDISQLTAIFDFMQGLANAVKKDVAMTPGCLPESIIFRSRPGVDGVEYLPCTDGEFPRRSAVVYKGKVTFTAGPETQWWKPLMKLPYRFAVVARYGLRRSGADPWPLVRVLIPEIAKLVDADEVVAEFFTLRKHFLRETTRTVTRRSAWKDVMVHSDLIMELREIEFPNALRFYRAGELVLYEETEFWNYIGGPSPYHDSTTLSFYSAGDLSRDLLAVCTNVAARTATEIIACPA